MTHTTLRVARPLLALALALAALAVRPERAAAQTDTAAVARDTVQEIRLADGSVLFGRVIEERGDEVVFRTVGGTTLTLRRDQIASLRTTRGRVVDGTVWNEDPNTSRLFFGPTARAVKKGEGYLGVFELFFPFLSYGVTDRFTMSGGTPIFPEAIGQFFYLAPKYEVVRSGPASAAVGVLAIFGTSNLDWGTGGFLYGVGTYGSPDNALTVGAAVPFIAGGGTNEIGNEPFFMVGGESRLTSRTKFITENYVVPTEGAAALSAGIRFFGERLSADFGVAGAFGDGESGCCLPLVNFIYTF